MKDSCEVKPLILHVSRVLPFVLLSFTTARGFWVKLPNLAVGRTEIQMIKCSLVAEPDGSVHVCCGGPMTDQGII